MGDYPVESVTMLAKLHCSGTRTSSDPVREMYRGSTSQANKTEHLIAGSVEATLEYVTPAAVFVPTRTGATARSIGRFRLPVWIIAVSSQEATCQNLQFSFGVFPVQEKGHPENWKPYVKEWMQRHGMPGDLVVLTEGPSSKHPDANHRMEIIDLRSS
jgi:pyruvate kinase